MLSERFWSKVNVTVKIRCWYWLGAKNSFGYGQLTEKGKNLKAPRVAYFLRNGRWPKNACHRCDNPACCNPDHIFEGTRSENARDMVSKGRCKPDRGESHGGAVLSNVAVIGIRSDYKEGNYSMESLAKKYSCSFSTIQRVITRKNWRHVP